MRFSIFIFLSHIAHTVCATNVKLTVGNSKTVKETKTVKYGGKDA